jgi:hypothetical protein
MLDFNSLVLISFIPCFICLNDSSNKKPNKTRAFMSNADKLLISNNIPLYFKEIITGMLLSDATLRMNGNMALLGIQQTHFELTNGL